jgi:hypothetical protein
MRKKLLVFILSIVVAVWSEAARSLFGTGGTTCESRHDLGKSERCQRRWREGGYVTVEGQNVKAVAASNGSFRLTGVTPGSVYLYEDAFQSVSGW